MGGPGHGGPLPRTPVPPPPALRNPQSNLSKQHSAAALGAAGVVAFVYLLLVQHRPASAQRRVSSTMETVSAYLQQGMRQLQQAAAASGGDVTRCAQAGLPPVAWLLGFYWKHLHGAAVPQRGAAHDLTFNSRLPHLNVRARLRSQTVKAIVQARRRRSGRRAQPREEQSARRRGESRLEPLHVSGSERYASTQQS
jgi:hypothetical protein